MDSGDWFEKYKDASICNIRRGKGERRKFIYAEIRDVDGGLLVSADLDYCTERMTQVTELLKPEE